MANTDNMVAKVKAILETLLIFILTLVVIGLFANSSVGHWENRVLKRGFIEYVLMIAIPLIILFITRRNLVAYGVSFKNIKYHLDIAFTCFIPFAAVRALLFLTDFDYEPLSCLRSWAFAVALVFIFGWLLRKKPSLGSTMPTVALLLFIAGCSHSSSAASAKAISSFVFFTFFVGPGEEILFRSYIQSRLNKSFGRPYRLFGVAWGWGLIITSALFGVFHFVNLPSLFEGQLDLQWRALFSNFFWSLPFAFLREKTGSIVAPAILHGLPQGIAWAFLGL